MFSALRENSLFYILEKGERPVLKVGQIQSVSQPVPKFNMGTSAPFSMDSTVDVSVRVGDQVLDFKQLPSSLSIANFGSSSVVVSESRELMASEVEAMMRTSRQLLESTDYHKGVIESCEGILKELNPAFAKEKQQEEKIDMLETKMGSIEEALSEVKNMLSNALSKTSS